MLTIMTIAIELQMEPSLLITIDSEILNFLAAMGLPYKKRMTKIRASIQ